MDRAGLAGPIQGMVAKRQRERLDRDGKREHRQEHREDAPDPGAEERAGPPGEAVERGRDDQPAQREEHVDRRPAMRERRRDPVRQRRERRQMGEHHIDREPAAQPVEAAPSAARYPRLLPGAPPFPGRGQTAAEWLSEGAAGPASRPKTVGLQCRPGRYLSPSLIILRCSTGGGLHGPPFLLPS